MFQSGKCGVKQLYRQHCVESSYKELILSDVQAKLWLKAMALAQPGGAHSFGEGQAEPRLSRRAGPQLGLGLGHGF